MGKYKGAVACDVRNTEINADKNAEIETDANADKNAEIETDANTDKNAEIETDGKTDIDVDINTEKYRHGGGYIEQDKNPNRRTSKKNAGISDGLLHRSYG